jgi:hypothetical protein
MSKEEREEGKRLLEKEYDASIEIGTRQHRYISTAEYCYDYDYSTHVVQTEPSIEITLSLSNYERLLSYLGFDPYTGAPGATNRSASYYHEIERRLSHERQLIEETPALKKSYEKYRLLLDMVKNGKKIED